MSISNDLSREKGGDAFSEGGAYQLMAATSYLLEMYLYKNYEGVKHVCGGSVDDLALHVEGNSWVYVQCKKNGESPNGGFAPGQLVKIMTDFFKQYTHDKREGQANNRYLLLSRSYPKSLDNILKIVKREYSSDALLEAELEKLSDTDSALLKSIFETLQREAGASFNEELSKSKNDVSQSDDDVVSLDRKGLFEFLRHVEVRQTDFPGLSSYWNPQLVSSQLPKYVYHILYTAVSYDWMRREITRKDIDELLKDLGLPVPSPGQTTAPASGIASSPSEPEFVFFRVDVHFFEKLSSLYDLIDSGHSKVDKRALSAVFSDQLLRWHFLKGLEDPLWFPVIKDDLTRTIVEARQDFSDKYQLLEFFEKCKEDYSDQIVPLLVDLARNTKNPYILASIVKSIPVYKAEGIDMEPVWEMLMELSEHQHPWVRKEVPVAVKKLFQTNPSAAIEVLQKLLTYQAIPQDVTQGSYTLALRFQGKDNENMVFEEVLGALGALMQDPTVSRKTYKLAGDILAGLVVREDEDGGVRQKNGVVIDYSSIWLGDKDYIEDARIDGSPKEMITLHILDALEGHVQGNPSLFGTIIQDLLSRKQEVFYLVVIKVLLRHMDQYSDLAEKVVFDEDLWLVSDVRDYFLQTLIQKYFEQTNQKLPEYVAKVLSLKEDDDQGKLVKFSLLEAIPDNLRPDDAQVELSRLSSELGLEPGVDASRTGIVSIDRAVELSSTEELLRGKSDAEVIAIFEKAVAGQLGGFMHDTVEAFANFIRENPSRLLGLITMLKGKDGSEQFISRMVFAYTELENTNLQGVLDIFPHIDASSTSARISIARFVEKECRKEEILSWDQGMLRRVKDAVFELSRDSDPEEDDKVGRPKPIDAITQAINSVRGIAAETLVVILHYFPSDIEVEKRLRELSRDNTDAVKANIISNLKYLIREKYDFCKEIVARYREVRNPDIDYALIHYFAHLGHEKFLGNMDFIRALFSDPHDEVQSELGELIARRHLGDDFNLADLIEAVIKGRLGQQGALRAMAFVFESSLAGFMGTSREDEVVSLLVQLLSPDNSAEVIERASYVFQRGGLNSNHFEVLDSHGAFDILAEHRGNVRAQSHLIEYLQQCVSEDHLTQRCIEILHVQIKNTEILIDDHLVAKDIAEIVNSAWDKDLSEGARKMLNDIFDLGLKRGWEEFYKIFEERLRAAGGEGANGKTG